MGVILYLDTVLIPLSLLVMIGYHAKLWHSFKNTPSNISIGIDSLKRKLWFLGMKQGDDKKGMLGVQSLRNTLMATILTAAIAILVNMALAALINNAYNESNNLFNSAIFGSKSDWIFALKYGTASLFLLVSFFCSAMGLGYLIDANFLINASGEFTSSAAAYTQIIFERGFMLALVGNRVLCMAFPLLLWMFGPLPVILSSVALVWGLYELDFVGNSFSKSETIVSLESL
ncbi:hypothetical protein Ddye_011062 [Dipteronia dyeriana]|uniref:DUF599 domain-containing protein n=1 Tax=Dipteronia dyeriana TaxID=168575 RepID=A0AAD9XEU0_9ROSI|nr:hypothetical protein Ddye_011062 [Dipteronia dyeriana]